MRDVSRQLTLPAGPKALTDTVADLMDRRKSVPVGVSTLLPRLASETLPSRCPSTIRTAVIRRKPEGSQPELLPLYLIS
jgi:hypothetical protein